MLKSTQTELYSERKRTQTLAHLLSICPTLTNTIHVYITHAHTHTDTHIIYHFYYIFLNAIIILLIYAYFLHYYITILSHN